MPRVTKRKRDEEEINRPLVLPECDANPEEAWYPPDWFLEQINKLMIARYGGYTGFESGLEPFHHFIEEAKKTEGIYRKGAVLLKNIATSRIFQDGHHRTAYIVVKTFLEKNDAVFKEKDEQKIIKFIKDIRTFSIEEIAGWIENGEL